MLDISAISSRVKRGVAQERARQISNDKSNHVEEPTGDEE
jgi:hypothetical protein